MRRMRSSMLDYKMTRTAAQSLGLRLLSLEVPRVEDLEPAITRAQREHACALLVLPDALTLSQRRRIADLASTAGLPAMSASRQWAEFGGLMAYGPDERDMFRRT